MPEAMGNRPSTDSEGLDSYPNPSEQWPGVQYHEPSSRTSSLKRPQGEPVGRPPDRPNGGLPRVDAVPQKPDNKKGHKRSDSGQKHQRKDSKKGQLSKSEKAKQKEELGVKLQTCLSNVIDIWDEFEELRDMDVKNVDVDVMHPLIIALGRMVDQHHYIRRMQAERHDMLADIADFTMDNDRQQRAMAEASEQIMFLKDDVAILSGELRRRGFAAHLPDRRASAPAEAIAIRESHSRGHSRESSGTVSTTGSDPDPPRKVEPEKQGVYRATPLVAADKESPKRLSAKRMSVDVRLTRTDIHEQQTNTGDQFSDELQAKLQSLARKSSSKFAETLRKRNNYRMICSDEVVTRYKKLESEAISKILGVIHIYASYADERTLRIFICRIYEISYEKAEQAARHFQQIIRTLMLNPVQPITEPENAVFDASRRRSSVMLYNSTAMSSLRTFTTSEVPENLTEQIRSYIESIAETVSITPLQEMVVENLREESPDLISANLLSNAHFDAFLSECCRLGWIMNVMTPPMYVCTEKYGGRVEAKVHTVLVTNMEGRAEDGSADIDFYVWPVLYSKYHGDVLHPGTVTTYRKARHNVLDIV